MDTISAVVAMEVNTRAIGKGNSLLWSLPSDLKFFKELTINHTVIMGRKTFESIINVLGHPLSDRTSIVISRTLDSPDGADFLVARSVDDAIALAKKMDGEVFIIGGAEIYSISADYIKRIYASMVDANTPDADTFFPDILGKFNKTEESEKILLDGIPYKRVIFDRIAV